MQRVLSVGMALLMAAFLSHGVNAATITIDFEDAPVGFATGNGFYGTYESQGFNLVSDISGWGTIGQPALLNNKAMLFGAWGFDFDLYGDDFTLTSFDVGFLSGKAGTATLRGYRDGSQVAYEAINIPAANALPFYQTVVMASGWENLDHLYFAMSGNDCCPGDASALDNIVLMTAAVVPVPAAIWLFGSGLIGLVWLPRKRRT